jgi:iron only hydrogenase large subunit-like protein/uncharacterized Fe-S cluster-containing protein
VAEYLKLKPSNCKNCYKCIRNCPVKSIRFGGNQANIIGEECILCGKCFVVCPQNAKEVKDDTAAAKKLIAQGVPVYASIAPSFAANYHTSITSMQKALAQLGFTAAEETALGATLVKKEYDRLVDEAKQDVIISSCCPTVNMLIQKYYPKAIQYLAPVVSPMVAHCMDIKRREPQAKTIFIGPCISKKSEIEDYGIVDCVLTFEELSAWLAEKEITPEQEKDKNDESLARLFPTSGGILRTMKAANPDYTYLSVDGIENCANAIEDVLNGKTGKCFIEMSACAGSCIGGPVMDKKHRAPVRDYLAVNTYAGRKDFPVSAKGLSLVAERIPLAPKQVNLSDSAVEEILKQMGKTRPEDELNCGSCGYNTCREKAKAVIQGKADLTMCLPFLKEKAESFSDKIIENTPNAILVLNESLNVQQLNTAACALAHVQTPQDVVGHPVERILDSQVFKDVREQNANIYDKRRYLAEYSKYVEQTVIFDGNYHIFICIMRDVTEEVMDQKRKEAVSRTTVEITDKVIEKQMRAVQEIASLLGETTAETKIALTKLKESLNHG